MTTKPELLWGASTIAETIGRDVDQTYWLLKNGLLPARKVGKKWVADKATLLTFLAGAPVQVN